MTTFKEGSKWLHGYGSFGQLCLQISFGMVYCFTNRQVSSWHVLGRFKPFSSYFWYIIYKSDAKARVNYCTNSKVFIIEKIISNKKIK